MSILESFWSRASTYSALLAVLMSVLAGVLTFTVDKSIPKKEIDLVQNSILIAQTKSELESELAVLKAQLGELTKVPENVSISSTLTEFERKLNSLEKQVTAINSVILESPEKAIEIPMLKRDIKSMQERYESSIDSLEREIARAYETITWVIGTILLGILGLAASVLFREQRDKT
ncbi:hypothetical protein ICR46_003605 [Vibrio cholerae]|nr:hypothetical protein [Vibrio cholerae]